MEIIHSKTNSFKKIDNCSLKRSFRKNWKLFIQKISASKKTLRLDRAPSHFGAENRKYVGRCSKKMM